MPCVGLEPTIPAYERVKTVHALDRSATVTGNFVFTFFLFASGVGLSPLYCGHFWPIVAAPDDR
jgi:hypothetical protein